MKSWHAEMVQSEDFLCKDKPMNARLSLLVLVVIIFMAIWDADRQGKAVSPPRAPHQPLSWHLPLPVTPDAAVMSPTPIIVPTITEVMVRDQIAEVTHVAVVEDHISEEPTTVSSVARTESKTEENRAVEYPSLEHGPSPSGIESTLPATESTVPAPADLATETESTVATESEPVVEVSTVTSEIAEVETTEVEVAEPVLETVSDPVKETEPVAEAVPPENLQTSDHWAIDRILQLSRTARASHEQTASPISPSLK